MSYNLTAAEHKALGSAMRNRHTVVYNNIARDRQEGDTDESTQAREDELEALESAATKLGINL